MTIDKKNKILIEYMRQCPQIDHLYAIFAKVEDGAIMFDPETNETLVTYWIDGRAYKKIVFTIHIFVSYSTNPVSSNELYEHENLLELEDMQKIIKWFKKKSKDREYPDFGQYVQIEEMYTIDEEPVLVAVDSEMSPPISEYSMSFALEYIEDEEAEEQSESPSI